MDEDAESALIHQLRAAEARVNLTMPGTLAGAAVKLRFIAYVHGQYRELADDEQESLRQVIAFLEQGGAS